MERGVTRAEWFAGAAFLISAASIIYSAGLQTQRINDHDRRLTAVEASQSTAAGKIETLLVTTSRIDANVSALADQAKEQRERGK
jgi:hypothetical protein